MKLNARNLVALTLSLIVAVSVVQVGFTPGFVSADNTITLQLSRAPTSNEPISASVNIEVNPSSGQVTIRIHQASPNSTYLAIFANAGDNIQLGNVTTSGNGEGTLQTTLGAGTYAGIFEILRISLLQFVSVNTSFTVGFTASISQTLSKSETSLSKTTTSETTSSQTSETESTVATGQARFSVEPATITINAGTYGRFSIIILANGTATVLLASRGIPPHSVAIFTHDTGAANPEFQSDLIIVTSQDTPIGDYTIVIISLINGQELDAQVNLKVAATSTASSQTSISTTIALEFSVNTDQHHYEPGSTVNVQGHVTDERGNAVADAGISLQVDGPTGAEIILMNNLKTNTAGMFQASFTLPSNATLGTYTAFASASKSGYANVTTHTTFVVGVSPTPSVVIREVYTTDITGNRSAVFATGQTVLVWVVVENSGATFQGVIWLQIRDTQGTPIWIQFQISQLETGQTLKIAFGFQLTAGVPLGLYAASALVSDKLISQGGSFFASANIQFAIAS